MNKRGFDCALLRAIARCVFADSLLPLAPFFSLFSSLYHPGSLRIFFPFFLVPYQVSNHLPLAYLSPTSLSSTPLHYEVQLRITPPKTIYIIPESIAFPKICMTICLFKCLMHVARCTKICIAFVGPWWIKGRGNDLFPSTSAVLLVTYTSMSSMNFFKLCKILVDHDQCIQWCKKHNLLTSSIKCPRENFSKAWRWRRRASSRDGYESRCSRRNCNGMALMRTENTWTGVKVFLVQEHPKISTKAIYGNGCGISTMETILLETLSSTSQTSMRLRKDV